MNCDYFKPNKTYHRHDNCPSCMHWLPKMTKCEIEEQVKRNDKTALVHESVLNFRRKSY